MSARSQQSTARTWWTSVYYLVAVVVPTALVLVAPAWWALQKLTEGLAPRPFASASYLDAGPAWVDVLRVQVLQIGWSFVALAWLGVLVGALIFRRDREAAGSAALGGHTLALILACAVVPLALFLTASNDMIIFEPYPHSGGVVGIGL